MNDIGQLPAEAGRCVAGTPFVVIYATDTTDDEVVVLRIVHGSQLRRSE